MVDQYFDKSSIMDEGNRKAWFGRVNRASLEAAPTRASERQHPDVVQTIFPMILQTYKNVFKWINFQYPDIVHISVEVGGEASRFSRKSFKIG